MGKETAPRRFQNILTGVLLLIGAACLLVGFFAFNWISVLGLGMSGLQLWVEANNPSSLVGLSADAQQLNWLILIPIIGLLVFILGFRITRRFRFNSPLARILILLLALVNFYPFYMVFSTFTRTTIDTTAFIGFGFWVALVGNIFVTLTVLLKG